MTKPVGGRGTNRTSFYSTMEAFVERARRDPETDREMAISIRKLAGRISEQPSESPMKSLVLIRTAVEAEILREIRSVQYPSATSKVKPKGWEWIGEQLGLDASGAHRKYKDACQKLFRAHRGIPKK